MIIMRHQLKELTASLTALVILAIYVLFHFVYVSVFLAFIFTGLLMLLARLGGAKASAPVFGRIVAAAYATRRLRGNRCPHLLGGFRRGVPRKPHEPAKTNGQAVLAG